MISRLKLDDLQSIQFDEVPQYLAFRQSIGGCDLRKRRAIDYQPSDQEQFGVGDDLLLLGQCQLVGRGALASASQNVGELKVQEFANLIHALQRQISDGEQPLYAGYA